VERQFEPELARIEAANAALERAVLAEDWSGAADSDAALNDALHALNRVIELAAGTASDGSLQAVSTRLGRVLEIHDRLIGVLVAARDVAGKDLTGSRLGRKAAFHYLDTAASSGR
jgi:hypothetical protein